MIEQELRERIAKLEADLAQARASLSFCESPAENEDKTSDREGFIECLIGGEDHIGDMLLRGLSGYWLRGLDFYRCKNGTAIGWLVEDFDCYDFDNPWHARHAHREARKVVGVWRDNNFKGALGHLPEGTYFIDREVALRAWEAGTERWGIGFGDGDCDYSDWDWAVQMGVLGECVYG